ncbi:odorant receptor 82a-like isoform X2 [Ceratina calcarata]|nr:odorant receptor 82a-like isoform X2 [Ceratina calcarata]
MHHQSRNDTKEEPSNWNSVRDVQYTLQLSKWLLKPIGVWPLVSGRSSRLDYFVSAVLMVTCFSSIFFIIVPSGHYVLYVNKSVQMKLKLFGPVGFCVSSVLKYCCLIIKSTPLKRCIQHVEKDWRTVQDPNHRGIMLKYMTMSRNLITICASFIYTGGMSFHTVMQFLSKEGVKDNSTFRPLSYPGYDWFLDVQSSPTYEIVFFTHCFAAMIMYTVTTAAYSFAAVFVTHICGQIRIQIVKLDELVERIEMKDDDLLNTIVHDHVEILRFAKTTEKALRELCFIQIVESTLIMCILEYYTIMGRRDAVVLLTYATLLISFTYNIFIFCYIGEILSEQFYLIGTTTYEIKWYTLPARKAHDLILLNIISQNPPKLTAGKIIQLSLDTFGNVVKTSVVYLNLILTITN